MFNFRALNKWPARRKDDNNVIYRSDRVLIRLLKGQNKNVVLCFNSLSRRRSGPPPYEFRKLASEERQHSVLYITDLTYSYYSQSGVRDEIIREVSRFLETSGLDCSCALGNSSGGYGAMSFADAFDLSNVLAIVPALSVAPEMVAAPEWDDFRDALGPGIHPSALSAIADTKARFCLIFGDQDANDNRQFALLQGVAPATSLHTLVVAGQDHAVARHLKLNNQLGPVISAALFGSDADVAAGLKSIPESVYRFADASDPANATFSFNEGETYVEV
jgi:hypothetical protein